ncbi:hypothetical protein PtrV1_13722 [Pyrenophora tritici-repentis]|nr:hypothetical protein PtrV1_13722 [Pyrenophora tritici-repentis]KAI1533565.1 hypothetical protein PtrSN001C_007559 [Pyrenophora tritici-repentis]KAI1536131.1 hypothetical protein PtrSN001A_005765 [Pyrenophora tritici-repentis]KAI1574158.1 hypothetical protein PtrEW4_003307 [Pyrenophora tritici-repentis]KAI1592703.1 hypothetical protein PtrEW13061_003588 [Pyrenophora tritici-repentis]
MPSWGRKESYEVSSKEQKQILADIQSGSQKFSRRLLPPRSQDNRRARNGDTIVPVTVTGEASQQEERRGRKSTSSGRPGLPKRTSSMKRAYNYFFGGAAPLPAPAEPTSPLVTTDATPPTKAESIRQQDNGVDTPPETPREPPRRLSEDEAGTSDFFTPPQYPLLLHASLPH